MRTRWPPAFSLGSRSSSATNLEESIISLFGSGTAIVDGGSCILSLFSTSPCGGMCGGSTSIASVFSLRRGVCRPKNVLVISLSSLARHCMRSSEGLCKISGYGAGANTLFIPDMYLDERRKSTDSAMALSATSFNAGNGALLYSSIAAL